MNLESNLEEIKNRQSNLAEKQKLLNELGLTENSGENLEYEVTEIPDWKRSLKRHNESCSDNACPLNFLTFGIGKNGRVIILRTSHKEDEKKHCSLNKESREFVYSQYNELWKALLPNKGLSKKEIEEEYELSKMTSEQKEIYLKTQEERKNKWIETVRGRKNSNE